MQVGLYQAASGMKANLDYQANIAANLARQSLVGGRGTITSFESLEEQSSQKSVLRTGPNRPAAVKFFPLQPVSTVNFSQGPIQQTGNPYNLAIQGQSFFVVQEPSAGGEPKVRYTRDGDFRLTPDGYLETPDGARLMTESGGSTAPLQIDPKAANRDIEVLSTGTVFVGGDKTPAGRIALARFDDPREALTQSNTGRFELAKPEMLQQGAGPDDSLLQGALEGSNVQTITEMVNLVQVMRNYESNQKVITTMDDLNAKIIQGVSPA